MARPRETRSSTSQPACPDRRGVCPSTRDVFSGPYLFAVFIVDVTAMFIVPAFIYVLQLMHGIQNLCDELNIWFQLM